MDLWQYDDDLLIEDKEVCSQGMMEEGPESGLKGFLHFPPLFYQSE